MKSAFELHFIAFTVPLRVWMAHKRDDWGNGASEGGRSQFE